MMDILSLTKRYSSGYKEIQSTIMKEILHYELLNCLFQNKETLQGLAFSGGTALRLCYGGVRYSEDLDFAIIDGYDFDFSIMDKFAIDIKQKIKQKFGLEVKVKNESLNKPNDMVQRWSTKVAVQYPKKEQERQPIINIEISRFNSFDASLKQIRNIYTESENALMLNVESLEEIFVGKIIAFGHRRDRNTQDLQIKYRDIWDIKFLIDNNIALDLDLFLTKADNSKERNKGSLKNNLQTKIKMLNEPQSSNAFYGELKRFLNKQDYDKIVNIDYFDNLKKEITKFVNKIIIKLDEIDKLQVHLANENPNVIDDKAIQEQTPNDKPRTDFAGFEFTNTSGMDKLRDEALVKEQSSINTQKPTKNDGDKPDIDEDKPSGPSGPRM